MKLVSNTFYSFLSMGVPLIISIVTVPFYISAIGAERYGALAIAWLLLGYFGNADFGMGRAITQRISSMTGSSGQERAGAVWSAITSIACFSAIAAVLTYSLSLAYFSGPFDISEDIRGELVRSVWALSLCVPLVALSGVTSGALMGLEKFRLVAVGNMIGSSGMQLLPLLVALLVTSDLTALISSMLIGRALGLAVVSIGTWTALLRGYRMRFSKAEFLRLAGFGAWIMVSALIGPLMVFSDRFLIGALLGAVAVTAYTIPFQVAWKMQIVPTAVVQALFPRFAAESDHLSRERCRDMMVFIGQGFAICIVGLICLSGPLLEVWLGAHLDPQSIPVAHLILVGVWINAMAQMPYSLIQARGNSRFPALLHLVELPIYFGMLYALGTRLGLTGIAAAFTLRCLGDFVALAWRAKILDPGVVGKVLAPALVIGAAAILAARLDAWGEALLAATALCAIAVGAMLVQMPSAVRSSLVHSPALRSVPGLARVVGLGRA